MRDPDELISWSSDWASLRVVVLGLGVTGFSAADTLVELGCEVLVVAERASRERSDLLSVIGARLVIQDDASHVPDELLDFAPALVIVSPGYPMDHVVLTWAAESGITVWGDIELAWRLRDKTGTPAQWIVVTGTNGKTTTVQLTTHLLRAAGLRAESVGNIGVPVLDAIRHPEGYDVLVVELSSFQLHWIRTTGPGALHPLASACLNVADDHLDWHGGRAGYEEAKARVYANTVVACVYNKADPVTIRMVEQAEVVEGCRAIGFDLGTPGMSDFGLVGDIIVDRAFLDDRRGTALELTTHGELQAAGLASPHMVANVLAASALSRAAGVPAEVVRDALQTFRVDHHRTETIGAANDVLWVDDSKATNPHATQAALSAFASVVWIVGGLLKGVDIGDLVHANANRIKAAVVIGVERGAVVAAFARHAPDVPVFEVIAADTSEVMPEAVRLAASVAGAGDVVLLAPAAASMDQFTDYGDRGDRFAAAVLDHLGGATDDHNPESGDSQSSS